MGVSSQDLVNKLCDEAGAALQTEVSDYQFLAEFRDYASGFRTLLVRKLQEQFDIIGWDDVALFMIIEEQQPAAQQPLTTSLKGHLTAMGFSWQEWQALRKLCDADIKMMLTGARVSLVQAIADIDGIRFPAGQEHVRTAVKKALYQLSTNMPVVKRK